MNRHTPGPWRLMRVWMGDHHEFRIIGDQREVCPDVFAELQSEREANAALIAAAPDLLRSAELTNELLATLSPLFGQIDELCGNTEYRRGIEGMRETIRLVISKAKGSNE